MKITAGTLFLAFAIFLDFIEIISSMYASETLTIKELFPEYNGGMPPIKEFHNPDDAEIQPLYSYGYLPMPHPPKQDFLIRGDVVVAWRKRDIYGGADRIEQLWKLMAPRHLPIVYHMGLRRWVYVHPGFEKLGFGHVLEILQAREHIADTTKLSVERADLSKAAHDYAYREANTLLDSLENDLAPQLQRSGRNLEVIKTTMRHKYTVDYTTLFGQFVQQYGHLSPDRLRNLNLR